MTTSTFSNSPDAWSSPSLFGEIFNEVPSGLVLLDGSGRVARANRAALTLLGEPLEGESWGNIIQRVFCLRPDDGHEVSLRNGRRVQIELADQIAQYQTLEYQGYVQDSASFAKNLIVEQNATNPNRVDVLWPGTLINQLRIFALLNQFRLQASGA